ncbi:MULTISPECIES: type IV pilin protein [Xanthomonas]|jgi:type IV pilus assembly protein PilE|uniref:type IV pilin protein n=1 Tax=Xanthomonas TaxID=338 RepID=UPI0008A5F9F8|nr:type IV pilin protein [Xanthomonas campestris]MBF9171937.1 type IV pilin protein [Xanthomonas campestris pv. campestris]MCC5093427.1 type IV pilin protein [Xanthomonas campestris pv. incanae]MCC5097546.1 type IV pilin protein [Xanthomonas campestris]MDO0847107.1 type IV pilin protein [Xanthomonas campestris pv. campestris]MDX6083606.1 type IV pilin protein [Xanthomonas campestris pv. incanae]
MIINKRGCGVAARASVRGFTLIELMITVAVVAILAAIAYPSYTEQIRKSRRAQAKADLMELANLAERFHTANGTFANFKLSGGGAFTQSPREGGSARYLLSLQAAPTASTFTVVATPQGDQVKDKCGTLSLNQAGTKTASTGTTADCW